MILFIFLFKLYQLWQLGALLVGFFVLLTCPNYCGHFFFPFLSTSLLSGMLQARLVHISCPSPSLRHFSKIPGSFYWRIRNQDLGIRCAHLYWSVLFLPLSVDRAQKHMCMLTSGYTHIYKYFYR